jgi:hypothetical protein
MTHVILSVTLRCPYCERTSVEQIIAVTERFDVKEMAKTLSRQPFDCQFCLRTVPDGTVASAHAELATPSQLKQLGFPSTRPN